MAAANLSGVQMLGMCPQAPALCPRPVSLPKCHLMKGQAGPPSPLSRERVGMLRPPWETFCFSFWEVVYYFSVSAIATDHRAEDWKKWKCFSHSSRCQKSEIKAGPPCFWRFPSWYLSQSHWLPAIGVPWGPATSPQSLSPSSSSLSLFPMWNAVLLTRISVIGFRGQQRMRWLDGITDSMDMSVTSSRRQGSVACCSPWGPKDSDTTERLNSNSS